MSADSLCADVTARIRRSGWECALVMLDDFRDRLRLDQIVSAEIASRRGPDRLAISDAGAMIALFVSVVEARV
jgi:hypothetical protein